MLQCMCRYQALNLMRPEVFEIAGYVFRRQKPTLRVLQDFLTSVSLVDASGC